MSKGTRINKKLKLSLFDIIRFQITFHCFVNRIRLSPAQTDCLALLGEFGEMNISDFCNEVVDREIFGNAQTVRNFIIKSVKDGLIARTGVGNKLISVNPEIGVVKEGNILLDLQVYHVESN